MYVDDDGQWCILFPFFRQEQVEGLSRIVGVRIRQVEERFDALGQGSYSSRLPRPFEKGQVFGEGNGSITVSVYPLEIRPGVSRQFLDRELPVLVLVPIGKDLLGIFR